MIRRSATSRTPPSRPTDDDPPESGRVVAPIPLTVGPQAAAGQEPARPGAIPRPSLSGTAADAPVSAAEAPLPPPVSAAEAPLPPPVTISSTPPPVDSARARPEGQDPPASVSSNPPPASSTPPPPPSLGERSLLADPTQRPPNAVTGPDSLPSSSTGAHKPLLASEALMEDLAPVEPSRADARAWCVVCGAVFLLFGGLPLLGVIPGALAAALPWLVTGVISLAAGIFNVGYRQRAVAMLVLGLLTGLVAQQESSVLLAADGGIVWGIARLGAVIALAASLVFRSRYRAYAGARVFLGVALLLSIPFVVHVVLMLTGDAGFGAAQIGAVLVLVAVAATLIGFMGAETTGAGPYLAFFLVIAAAFELGMRGVAVIDVFGPAAPLFGVAAGATGFGAAAGFTALGLFQILAWRFAADARRIDLHSPRRENAPESEQPVNDWSTRE